MTITFEPGRRPSRLAAARLAGPWLAVLAAAFAPSLAQACACGCGVFDVGEGTLAPTDSPSGFTGWFRYSYMDQNQNWERGHKAPASDNTDKDLETSFYTVGGEYMINHRWSVMAELPIYDRRFVATDDGSVAGPAGSLYHAHLTALGDLQLSALYTGLSADMSTGLSLGVKLPTGDARGPKGSLGGAELDRDTLPGTGSTDLTVGAYHLGAITADRKLTWFVQGRYAVAVATWRDYRPGNELDAAAGVRYNFGAVGKVTSISPTLQLINSYRAHDTGANADPPNSGYERLLIAPGVEAKVGRARVYADVELPIHQHVNAAPDLTLEGKAGQLVAPVLLKVQLTYGF